MKAAALALEQGFTFFQIIVRLRSQGTLVGALCEQTSHWDFAEAYSFRAKMRKHGPQSVLAIRRPRELLVLDHACVLRMCE